MEKKTILVTGGLGYIGSHCVIKLIEAGYLPVILDNLSNSCLQVLERIQQISGVLPVFYKGDILDTPLLERIFREHFIYAVIHFAGKKSVSESQKEPLEYFDVNVAGSLSLLSVMKKAGVNRIVFSSTATVYDSLTKECLSEGDPLGPINNYGKSKLMVEQILQSLWQANPDWSIAILRYFNPVGAHPSGLIGEDPRGIPANIMPFISQVAIGRRPKLQVFGNDYATRDGTGARDFIHVEDLAEGHLKVLERLDQGLGVEIFNLGTGNNFTVLELISAFEKANGVTVPFEIVGRRPGDSGACYANPTKANSLLNWKAKKDILDMCRDTWNWQIKNPNGYQD